MKLNNITTNCNDAKVVFCPTIFLNFSCYNGKLLRPLHIGELDASTLIEKSVEHCSKMTLYKNRSTFDQNNTTFCRHLNIRDEA